MTTNTPPAPTANNAIRDAIADIRHITSEKNLESFSNDDLLDACIRLVQADDAAGSYDHADAADGAGDFIATLDAARHRAGSYDHAERTIITRAISRANRSLANR